MSRACLSLLKKYWTAMWSISLKLTNKAMVVNHFTSIKWIDIKVLTLCMEITSVMWSLSLLAANRAEIICNIYPTDKRFNKMINTPRTVFLLIVRKIYAWRENTPIVIQPPILESKVITKNINTISKTDLPLILITKICHQKLLKINNEPN